MSKKTITHQKVNENLTIYRYDNGWMLEVSGRNKNGDYKTSKILCNTEDELISLIKDYNQIELDN